MFFKLLQLVRKPLRATRFWQENHLILREFKSFRWLAIAAVCFALLASITEGFGLGFLLAFLQSLTSPDAPPVQTGIEWFDVWVLGVNAPVTQRIYRVSGLIVAATCIRAVFNYLAQYYTLTSEVTLIDRLRKRVFEQLQSQRLSYFSQTRSGELVDVLTSEMERIRNAFGAMSFLMTRAFTLLVYAIAILLLSWQLSLISILLFGGLAFGFSKLNKRVRRRSTRTSQASGRLTSIAIEFINGIRTVQAFSAQDFERRRFYQASTGLVQEWKTVYRLSCLVRPLAEASATFVLVGMIILALTNRIMPVASLLTFLFILFRMVPYSQDLLGVFSHLSTMMGSVENIKRLLSDEGKQFFEDGTRSFPGLFHGIEFVAVDFGYDPDHLVLKDINLCIEKGKTTALVGASGSGKSTLADLISRFYDPTAGRVLLDGIDLREFEIDSVRHRLAIVSQDTFIFNASVRSNIAYGSEQATDSEVYEAARLANALEFILEMPEGFETTLGDRGIRLSGGQRQRIAIARALLRNPEILILDEATSALDSVSERLIQEALEKLSVGRTVLAIAHRLSTISGADKIVVLEQGRIVEQGGYRELIDRRDRFWKYYQIQQAS
ncbi:ABC transporter ATP-binding protein [Thermoleptolyngbya sichuanensis A183]|uniref:ABC transporter ATP-binding protein n=1 Tax=Thermoleptolyngbya sichuanensis A183 TaxID=2737172 RepID=A0A6M8BFH8_9CYAN|nr:heterocyst formation ABC transporter subunit HepA [Thermoleptolyngbya sichuanensis]QKD83000.1 ABC transporter ATP-binding protein [Thermoleptolyngbya sichuanensis A183]